MLDIQKPWQKKVATPQISETLQWCSLNQTVWRMAQKTTWRDQATSRISPSDRITRPRAARRTLRNECGARAGHYGASRGALPQVRVQMSRGGPETWLKSSWGYLTPTWDMLKYVEWLQVPKKRNAPQIVIKSLEGKLLIGSSSWGLEHSNFSTPQLTWQLPLQFTLQLTLQLTLHSNLHSVTTYITLPCIALHSSPLHSITLHSITLHYNLHYITLQRSLHYIATFIALHHVTLHYISTFLTLPYITFRYITVHYITYMYMDTLW